MSSSHRCCGGDGGGCRSQLPVEPRGSLPEEREPSVTNAAVDLEGRRSLLCRKCGEAEVSYERQCSNCFRSSIFGKFKLAVTSNAMISPLDNVLVAFSGGSASRIALQFVHEMQQKAQRTWETSKDQSLPVFGVGVAFVDESSFSPSASHDDGKEAIERIREVVSSLAPPTKRLYVASIGSICSMGSDDGKGRLGELLEVVDDATGREDLFLHARMLCLQKMALDNGFSKLLLGSCSTATACHILSATVKGQGYSLPADIQYVDARWEVPVVFPLRDCLSQELSMLCHLDSLRTEKTLGPASCGINELISSFLERLQEENPSRARTIVRTAEKLTPFTFNKLDNVSSDMLPSRVRWKFRNTNANGLKSPEIFCPICRSPISDLDLQFQGKCPAEFKEEWDHLASNCCQSCSNQILPDASKLELFYSLLPLQITKRVEDVGHSDHDRLREQIEDFLLPEDDEET